MSELCYFIVFCLDVVILCVHVFMLLTERFIRILHYHYTKFYIGQHSGRVRLLISKKEAEKLFFFSSKGSV